MKTWLKPAASLLVAGTLIAGGTFVSGALNAPVPVYADGEMQKNVVTVVGSGELSVKPDVAYLS
ncbi:MAG: SIMPL domain-containing protein, partial [Paenibacillaceae bacterium]|nr:SIMPL domain-containing protein [Paenibacillaceae bacterium]